MFVLGVQVILLGTVFCLVREKILHKEGLSGVTGSSGLVVSAVCFVGEWVDYESKVR